MLLEVINPKYAGDHQQCWGAQEMLTCDIRDGISGPTFQYFSKLFIAGRKNFFFRKDTHH